MASRAVFDQGYNAKSKIEDWIFYANFSAGIGSKEAKRLDDYLSGSNNWAVLANIDDVLKSVQGTSNIPVLKKGIIVALGVIHNKSKAELATKLHSLAALGEQELIEEYKAVLKRAGSKPVEGLGIQLTLRNFELVSETYAEKAVAALKLVREALPDINQRLLKVGSDANESTAFQTWFGDRKVHEKVSNNFKMMAGAVENRHVILSFDGTGCQKTETGGYVYDHKTNDLRLCNIHLCRKIFADDQTVESVATVIMHELSHAVAHTKDVNAPHSYGEYTCQEFAKTDPEKAADNADNYRWYAFPDIKPK